MKDLKICLPPGSQLHVTSDLHLGHANIIRFSARPFADVKEMDAKLISNWNACVQPNDVVFCLGDFAMGKREQLYRYLRQLNGEKHLIMGNHDAKTLASDEGLLREFFKTYSDLKDVKVQDASATDQGGYQRITFCHYAMRVWNKSHYGSWNLYGHSHGGLPESDSQRAMDCGVDAVANRFGKSPEDYRPISYAEIKAIMAKKKFTPIDHHGRRED